MLFAVQLQKFRDISPDNRTTAGVGIIAVLQHYEIKSEELSGSVS